jgi:hypothetical protein
MAFERRGGQDNAAVLDPWFSWLNPSGPWGRSRIPRRERERVLEALQLRLDENTKAIRVQQKPRESANVGPWGLH